MREFAGAFRLPSDPVAADDYAFAQQIAEVRTLAGWNALEDERDAGVSPAADRFGGSRSAYVADDSVGS